MNPELTQRLKDLYKVQKKIKELSSEKTELQGEVEELIVEGGMEEQKIEVGGDATFCYKKNRVVGSISQKLLKDRLKAFFSRGGEEATDDEVEELYDFILAGRNVSEKFQLTTVWKKAN